MKISFEVGNTYGFTYANKVRVCKVEKVKVGPSGEVLTGLTYTDNDKQPAYRSFSVSNIDANSVYSL